MEKKPPLDRQCFHGELDVGKHYKTFDTAKTALLAACKTLSLPEPIINCSGTGLHFYFPLAEPMTDMGLWLCPSPSPHGRARCAARADGNRKSDEVQLYPPRAGRMRRRVRCVCPGMLSASVEREMACRGLTDSKIAFEEDRQRTEMVQQCEAHLRDLKNAFPQKLQSLRLVGEDVNPLIR